MMEKNQEKFPVKDTNPTSFTSEEMDEFARCIALAAKLTRQRVYELKKQKGTGVVISRNGKVEVMTPDDWIKEFPIEND